MQMPTKTQLYEVLEQMKNEGRMYIDYSREFEDGINISYAYDREKKQFIRTEMDIVVGAFCYESTYTEEQMIDALGDYPLQEFIKRKFDI